MKVNLLGCKHLHREVLAYTSSNWDFQRPTDKDMAFFIQKIAGFKLTQSLLSDPIDGRDFLFKGEGGDPCARVGRLWPFTAPED